MLEEAAEGGLLGEAHLTGNLLNGEVAPTDKQRLGLQHDIAFYPLAGRDTCLLLDKR